MAEKFNEPEPVAVITAEEQRSLDYVAEVSKNARTTWFGLIGLLLFCGVTLLGVEDRDFFEYGASTQLPLINVSVPTESFFWAAPLLVTGLFTYLHLYLDKLWKALKRLENAVGGRPVTEVVYPWLISDTALGLRKGVERGPYWFVTRIVTLSLCWLIGPVVMYFFWTRSWAPHDEALTTLIGVQLVWVSVIGVVSWLGMCRETPERETMWRVVNAPVIAYLGVMLALLVGGYGFGKTESGRFGGLYSAQLYRANFVKPEKGWRDRDRAWRNFRRTNREDVSADVMREDRLDGPPSDDAIFTRMSNEFRADRREDREKLERGYWTRRDLRSANLEEAKLVALNLTGARLDDANLARARMEGANLEDANLQRADLTNGRLEEAKLARANLQDTKLTYSRLQGADLTEAHLDRAKLIHARLDRANLTEASLNDAVLNEAKLPEANLTGAFLSNANISYAWLDDAHLTGAMLDGADLTRSWLRRADLTDVTMRGALLRGVTLDKALLIDAVMDFSDLTEASLIEANLSGAQLGKAIFTSANLSHSDLTQANLVGASLNSAVFEEAYLAGAVFSGADLRKASFKKATLRRVQFEGVDLSEADITGAYVNYSTLVGAKIYRLKGLTQGQINQMFGDGSSPAIIVAQHLSDGEWVDVELARPSHWPESTIPREQHLACWKEWAVSNGATEFEFPETDLKCTTHADSK